MVHKAYSKNCPEYDNVFDTPDHYYNHYRGAHGKGYKTHCGQTYQWPEGWARLHEACTKCRAIIKAEKDRAEKLKLKLPSHGSAARFDCEETKDCGRQL